MNLLSNKQQVMLTMQESQDLMTCSGDSEVELSCGWNLGLGIKKSGFYNELDH